MPRIYSSASDPFDFCRECFPDEFTAEEEYGNEEKYGEGPDERGNCFDYEADHPPYDYEDYRCVECNRVLTGDDD